MVEAEVFPNLKAYIDKKKIHTGHLKFILDVVFMDYSMWVSGWTKNIIGKNDTGPEYTVQAKKKKRNKKQINLP